MGAGAPRGNQNAAKGKQWLAAIERALEKRSRVDRKAGLDALAGKLLEQCAEGNLVALKELGDRLDGKPSQSVDMAVTNYSHEDALDALEHGSDSTERHKTH